MANAELHASQLVVAAQNHRHVVPRMASRARLANAVLYVAPRTKLAVRQSHAAHTLRSSHASRALARLRYSANQRAVPAMRWKHVVRGLGWFALLGPVKSSLLACATEKRAQSNKAVAMQKGWHSPARMAHASHHRHNVLRPKANVVSRRAAAWAAGPPARTALAMQQRALALKQVAHVELAAQVAVQVLHVARGGVLRPSSPLRRHRAA